MRGKSFLFVATIFLVSVEAVWASQAMKAASDETPVYDAPSKDAQVLRRVFQGTPFAASNAPIEGYYKVKTTDGIVGFVLTQDLVASDKATSSATETAAVTTADEAARRPVESAESEPPVVAVVWPKHELRTVFGPALYGSNTLQNRLSATMGYGWDFSVEYRYQWRDRIYLLGSAQLVMLRTSISNALGAYDLRYTSIPLSAGFAYDWLRSSHWHASLAALWGLGWKTRFEAELQESAEPRTTTIEVTPFVQTVKVDFCSSGRSLGFCMDAGWMGLFSSSVSPNVFGYGYSIVGTQPMDLGQSGFFIRAGVSWGLD